MRFDRAKGDDSFASNGSLSEKSFEKILYFQVISPAPKVGIIELPADRTAHAEKIVPLAFGAFSARAIPFQLSQDRVLRGGDSALNLRKAIGLDLAD